MPSVRNYSLSNHLFAFSYVCNVCTYIYTYYMYKYDGCVYYIIPKIYIPMIFLLSSNFTPVKIVAFTNHTFVVSGIWPWKKNFISLILVILLLDQHGLSSHKILWILSNGKCFSFIFIHTLALFAQIFFQVKIDFCT